MKDKLTPKQRIFVQQYLLTGNGTQSAIEAGYSKASAGAIAVENLNKPLIAEAIKVERDKVAKKFDISKESLINDLITIKDMCLGDTRVIHNSIKAIDSIAKMLGLNEVEKQDVTTNGQSISQDINIKIVRPKNDE